MIDIPLTIIHFFPVNKIMTVMKTILWSCLADGIPNDGTPIEEVVTVSVALTVVYVVFAVLLDLSLLLSVSCLLSSSVREGKLQTIPIRYVATEG